MTASACEQACRSDRVCPLCLTADGRDFHSDRTRVYFRCPACDLIFVPPGLHPTAAAEKAEYDLHRNSPDDVGYRRFLNRLFAPMQDRLEIASSGLDFGSGPGPTLSVMFEEVGHRVRLYDPFYAPDAAVFSARYDFITATEVVEHLHRPRAQLARVWSCLKPGGTLGIMTKLALDATAFAEWHYKNDLTHVCFFSRATFRWLANHWQAELTFVAQDAVLLTKPRRL